MLKRFLTDTVIVRRLKTTSGNKKAFEATATVVCNIQSYGFQARQKMEGVNGKLYKAWFEANQDIQENDQLQKVNATNNGPKYRVLEVERLGQGLGLMSEHLEIIMMEYNDKK